MVLAIPFASGTMCFWMHCPIKSMLRFNSVRMSGIESLTYCSYFFRMCLPPRTIRCNYMCPSAEVSLRVFLGNTSSACRSNTTQFPSIDTEVLGRCRKTVAACRALLHQRCFRLAHRVTPVRDHGCVPSWLAQRRRAGVKVAIGPRRSMGGAISGSRA